MSRFSEFLHRTGERLALPKATRSLILVEIAADLEDLFNYYVEQGLSEEEAVAKAEERVDMSDEALTELVRIHSDSRGWSDRIVRRARPFWERIAMAVIVLFFILASTLDHGVNPLANRTVFFWPIVGILIALIAVFVLQMVRLADQPNLRALRNGLATPLFLGAASLVVGFAGSGIELYRSLKGMVADPENAAAIFSRAALGTTATLSIALLVALAAGVAWFYLAGKVARIEDRAAETFLEVR